MTKLISILLIIVLGLPLFAQQSDLEITKFEGPYWDDSTRIFITIHNKGDVASEAVTLKVWDLDISAKKAKKLGFKNSDMWIFKENVARAEGKGNDYDLDWEVKLEIPPLDKGESTKVEVNVEHWIYDSNCEIGAIIDSENVVKEKNEKNNTFYFAEGG